MSILNLSVTKLKQIVSLKMQIEHLQSQLETLVKAGSPAPAAPAPLKKKRKMSAAARKKISQAAKARWAKVRAAKAK